MKEILTLLCLLLCVAIKFFFRDEEKQLNKAQQRRIKNENRRLENENRRLEKKMLEEQKRLEKEMLEEQKMENLYYISFFDSNKNIISSLLSSKSLLEVVNKSRQTIKDCVCYDFMQIYRMLYGSDFERYSKEAFFLLSVAPIENAIVVKDNNYKEVFSKENWKYYNKKHKEHIKESFTFLLKLDNPVEFNFGLKSDSMFSLLTFLKHNDKETYKKYATLLEKFTQRISMVDNIATNDELEKIRAINKEIYGN